MHKNHLFTRFFITAISLLCLGAQAMAQDEPDYFVYADEGHTTIIGMIEAGLGETELTIPASVTTVGRKAFYLKTTEGYSAQYNSELNDLHILGNPMFEIDEYGESALTDVKGSLESIDMGSNMSLDNIEDLLLNAYGQYTGELEDIIIQDYLDTNSGEKHGPVVWGYVKDENGYGQYQIGEDWYDKNAADPINQVLTKDVRVIMPAEIVKYQIFGCAQVWGRITLSASLSTTCWDANFYDLDDGANYLFYVPTELLKEEKKVYFQRVKIITEKEGVLMHNAENTSIVVNLPRINTGDKYIEENIQNQNQFVQYEQKMKEIYAKNMLVGVTEEEGRLINATEGDYTNFILYHGMFYPTSGGRLKANRAYLQILTSEYAEMQGNQGDDQDVSLSIVFDDDEEDAIHEIHTIHQRPNQDAWFTIDGRQLSTHPTLPGIYIHGGKVVIVDK